MIVMSTEKFIYIFIDDITESHPIKYIWIRWTCRRAGETVRRGGVTDARQRIFPSRVLTLYTSLNPPRPSRCSSRYRSLRVGWSLNLEENTRTSEWDTQTNGFMSTYTTGLLSPQPCPVQWVIHLPSFTNTHLLNDWQREQTTTTHQNGKCD